MDLQVLAINISLRPNSEKIIFPIGIGYITTAIKNAGFKLQIYDIDVLRPSENEIEEFLKNTQYDVVCMGCIVTGYKFVKRYCDYIKKYNKDAPIIVGNSVATSIPEILLNCTKADIGVMSEGDITIVELLNAIANNQSLDEVKGIIFRKNGKLFFTEKRQIISNLDTLPMIDYSMFNMNVYLDKCRYIITEPYPLEFNKLKPLPINTARGCPFHCTFCYHVFRDYPFRMRSVKHIADEILFLQEKYGLNYVQFYDELSIPSKKRADELANYFINNNIQVFWEADIRAGLFGQEDIDLVKKLKKAGCVSVAYSLESADTEILKMMDKKITVEQFEAQTKVLHQAKIGVSTSLVIGYPQETKETLQKTFDVCYNYDIYPSVGYLLPQPGTPMYKYAIEKGFIKNEEVYLLNMNDRQDFTLNMTKIAQEEIELIVKQNLKRIAKKLQLNLGENQLIRTGHVYQKKHNP